MTSSVTGNTTAEMGGWTRDLWSACMDQTWTLALGLVVAAGYMECMQRHQAVGHISAASQSSHCWFVLSIQVVYTAA